MRSAARVQHKRRKFEHSGTVMVFFVASLGCILFIGAFTIDILRLERLGRSLQRTVDAAALAGALELRSDAVGDLASQRAGWIRSKHAVFAFLAQNPIANINFNLSGQSLTNCASSSPVGHQDYNSQVQCSLPSTLVAQAPCGSSPNPNCGSSIDSEPYNYTRYLVNGRTTTIRIERGVFNSGTFTSWETAYPGSTEATVLNTTDSVRVSMIIPELPNSLLGILGIPVVNNISRVSIGAPD